MKVSLKYLFLSVFILSILNILSGNTLAKRAIPDNNLAYPVLITGHGVSGSGAYYRHNNKFYLVTARHVLFDDANVSFRFDEKLINRWKLKDQLLRKLTYDKKRGKLSFFGTMTEKERENIIATIPSNNSMMVKRINELFEKSQSLTIKMKKLRLISYPPSESTGISNVLELNLGTLNQSNSIIYNKSYDIAAVNIGEYEVSENNSGKFVFKKNAVSVINLTKVGVISFNKDSIKKFNDVLVGNEVYLFGYPTSLSLSAEIDIKRPLLRRGVVAGKNDALRTIILDCPVFFGNSGGLVLEVEQINLSQRTFRPIGIISKLVPFKAGWKENSGYSIAESLEGLLEILPD